MFSLWSNNKSFSKNNDLRPDQSEMYPLYILQKHKSLSDEVISIARRCPTRGGLETLERFGKIILISSLYLEPTTFTITAPERSLVPLFRMPSTSADQVSLAHQPYQYWVRHPPKSLQPFFNQLTELLNDPVSLAPSLWDSMVEIRFRVWECSTMVELLGRLIRHAPLHNVFVAFRAAWMADAEALLTMFEHSPGVTFPVYLALYGSFWNMWTWDEKDAFELWSWVSAFQDAETCHETARNHE